MSSDLVNWLEVLESRNKNFKQTVTQNYSFWNFKDSKELSFYDIYFHIS